MKRYQCVVCGLIYDEAQGWPEDEILRNYPGLEKEDIQACLRFSVVEDDRIRMTPLPRTG